MTLAYITKRLSEEEKKHHPVGGQTALLIYSEGRGLHTSDPLPFPAPSRRIRLLHQPSPALGHRLPSPAASYWLPPHSPPRAPTTGFHRLRHLARPRALTTGFHRLRHLMRLWAVTVSPSSVSNSVETSTSLAPPLHHQVRLLACGGTSGGRCRLLVARSRP